MVRVKTLDFIFGYLTVGGKVVTSNTTLANPGAVTGPLTANATTEMLTLDEFSELSLHFLVGSPTGASPALSLALVALDPMEGSSLHTITLTTTPLSATSKVDAFFKGGRVAVYLSGTAGSVSIDGGAPLSTPIMFNVPMLLKVYFAIGPMPQSWPVQATYEARR